MPMTGSTLSPEIEATIARSDSQSRMKSRSFRENESLTGLAILDQLGEANDLVIKARARLSALAEEVEEFPPVAEPRAAHEALTEQLKRAEECKAQAITDAADATVLIRAALANGREDLTAEEVREAANATLARMVARIADLGPLLETSGRLLASRRSTALATKRRELAQVAEAQLQSFKADEAALMQKQNRETLALPWIERQENRLLLGIVSNDKE